MKFRHVLIPLVVAGLMILAGAPASPASSGPLIETITPKVVFLPPPASSRPGKGCGDKNHVHERYGECAVKPGRSVGGNAG